MCKKDCDSDVIVVVLFMFYVWDFIDKFLLLAYNDITNTCKTTIQSMVKEESLWQNRY